MNHTRRTFLKGVAAASVSLTAVGPAGAAEQSRYIVTGNQNATNRIEDVGFSVQHELADGRVQLVVGPEDRRGDLEGVRGVEHVARDYKFELETPELTENADADADEAAFTDLQWDKHNTDAFSAHDRATGDGTRLAIIDTGIDHDHPDLEANVNADLGRLFKFGDVTEDTTDVYGHGTHVAGIAAASHGDGVVGMAPDAELVSLRVFYHVEDSLYTTTGDILLAIDHAADLGADAANMSIGTPPLPPRVNATGIRVAYERVSQDAARRGTAIVVSAGNSDADLQRGGYFTVPNSVAGAMSISATGPNDERTFYSNYGTNEITVGAPGGAYETLDKTLETDEDKVEWPFPTNLVLSSVPPALYGGLYAYFAGTSMAAPQVTGLAGLVREVTPDATARQVEQAIKAGAEGANGDSDKELGAGRINAAKTLDTLE